MIYLPLDKLMERSRDSDANTVTVRPPVSVEPDPPPSHGCTPTGGTLMGSRILAILVLLLAVILLISSSMLRGREQELALRVQLSQIMGADYKPGLQFKIPFVDDVVEVRPARADAQVQWRTVPDQREPGPHHRLLHQVAHPRCGSSIYQATSGGDEGSAPKRWWATTSRTASRTPSRAARSRKS